jgi:hypothetical protein
MEKNQMNNEKREFLNLKNFPARLEVQEAAWYLGFAPHAIPILIRAGLLKPLGRPAASGVKYFATATLAELRDDTRWLARASDALTRYWQYKNGRKSSLHSEPASRTVSQSHRTF